MQRNQRTHPRSLPYRLVSLQKNHLPTTLTRPHHRHSGLLLPPTRQTTAPQNNQSPSHVHSTRISCTKLPSTYFFNKQADDNDISQLGTLISVTEGNLYKQIETKDKENMEISKHDAFVIFNFVFKHMKAMIKKYKNISIQLDFLGTISIYERTFIH